MHLCGVVFWQFGFGSLVPVPAVGFKNLQGRIEAQTQLAAVHREKLKVHLNSLPFPQMFLKWNCQELQSRITTLTLHHGTTNLPRLTRAAVQ
jgi:hypothetical protein